MYADLDQMLTHVVERSINKGTTRGSVPALTYRLRLRPGPFPDPGSGPVPALAQAQAPAPHLFDRTEEPCLAHALTQLKFRRSTCPDPLRPRSSYCPDPGWDPGPVPALT